MIRLIEQRPIKAKPGHYPYQDTVVGHFKTMEEAAAEIKRLKAEHPNSKFTCTHGERP